MIVDEMAADIALARILRALHPQVSERQIELAVIDLRRRAERALAETGRIMVTILNGGQK